MTRDSSILQALEDLESAISAHHQLEALKRIKSEIIGHEKRKQSGVQHGLTLLLVQCLIEQSFNEDDDLPELKSQAQLFAVHIVISLANAGNPYIAPLVNANAISALLSTVLTSSNDTKLRLEALRALTIIVKSLHQDPLEYYAKLREFVHNDLIIPATVKFFAQILDQAGSSHQDDDFFNLVLILIRYTATDDDIRQRIYTQSGILDILASKLSSWIVKYQVIFRKNCPAYTLERLRFSPPQNSLTDLVLAIAAIIRGSHYRSLRLLFSQDIAAILPTTPSLLGTDIDESLNNSIPSIPHPWERLLPHLTTMPPNISKRIDKPIGQAFPALASYSSATPPRVPFVSVFFKRSSLTMEPTSHFLAWLIYMTRTIQGNDRIAILWLLSVLVKATELSNGFGKPLALLTIPILLRLINDDASVRLSQNTTGISPEILLSEFISKSGPLQSAAFEGEAVKPLTTRLRKAFDSVKSQPSKMWSSSPNESIPNRSLQSAILLGPEMPTDLIITTLQYRCDVMKALAAIAEKENTNKIDIIKTGITGPVLDALNPYPTAISYTDPDFKFIKPNNEINPKAGNPTYVIRSALSLLTALSRSTNVLRTSLMDNNVAKPVLTLLKHEDPIVKLDATNIVINLVLFFSPMKEELIRDGIITILSEYAHSTHTELKISALWALKHLVLQASEKVRIQVLDELGSTYLCQLLSGDISSRNHLATPNALGEQVDLLNDDPSMDLDSKVFADDEDFFSVNAHWQAKYGPAKQFINSLQNFKYSSDNISAQAREDSIRIQHHTLDLIRNITTISNDKDSVGIIQSIIDKLLNSFGSNRFFELILTKIRPTASTGSSPTSSQRTSISPSHMMNTSTTSSTKLLDPSLFQHVDLVLSALTILVHLATGRPSQRRLLLTHATLMPTILPHFKHPDERCRSAACWMVLNILWQADETDQPAARERAKIMRDGGIEVAVTGALEDDVLDVKERAKACVESFRQLLDANVREEGRESTGLGGSVNQSLGGSVRRSMGSGEIRRDVADWS